MIIVFGHQKGGTGKSTLTVNMAVELQRQGKDVLEVRISGEWYGQYRKGSRVLDAYTAIAKKVLR